MAQDVRRPFDRVDFSEERSPDQPRPVEELLVRPGRVLGSQPIANSVVLESSRCGEATMMSVDVAQLMGMSQSELDALFGASPPGAIPNGEADGTVIVAPGTPLEDPAAKLIHLIGWHGKVFDPERGELRNRILPFDMKAVIATVYSGPSWFDGKPCIVLDYSKTSLIAHWIRDEIREVSPGTYLGLVFWKQARILNFVLNFGQNRPSST